MHWNQDHPKGLFRWRELPHCMPLQASLWSQEGLQHFYLFPQASLTVQLPFQQPEGASAEARQMLSL